MEYLGENPQVHLDFTKICESPAHAVRRAEHLFWGEICKLARHIARQHKRIVLIAGPSSSAKTSTAQALATRLQNMGGEAVRVSLDDFFVNRDELPLLPNGLRDFEGIHALDLPLLEEFLRDLLAGQPLRLPHYDFVSGTRAPHTTPVPNNENTIFLFEGIHALHPLLCVDHAHCLRVYLSLFSSFHDADGALLLSELEMRLTRRMVRDFFHRAYNADDTFRRWPEVLRGEEENITPYRDQADVWFNSFHCYEPLLFAPFVLDITRNMGEFAIAGAALAEKYAALPVITPDALPPESVIHEFLPK